ncbi:hypothetical protein C0J52_22393 [Blattella germanica]|nr:hypothetical protein C0J52_22393 [Blattella germanica]
MYKIDPGVVLGTVTIEDQMSYIKIETLCGKNTTDIHRVLSEVSGESTVDRSTTRPRTSTDEQNVKLVADALEKNCRLTCVEFFEATSSSPTSVYRILTHDLKKRKISARWVPHCLTAESKSANTEENSDISPPDFDLFPKLREPMRGRHYPSLEVLSITVTRTIGR